MPRRKKQIPYRRYIGCAGCGDFACVHNSVLHSDYPARDCPHCGRNLVYQKKVRDSPRLTGGDSLILCERKGYGFYAGCCGKGSENDERAASDDI